MQVCATGLLLLAGLSLLSACGDSAPAPLSKPSSTVVTSATEIPSEIPSASTAEHTAVLAPSTFFAAASSPVALTGGPARMPPGIARGVPSIVVPGIVEGTPRKALLQTPGSPGAGELGPPEWVKAGTRLTFYSAAASVAQSRFAWVEDASGPWTDPATGKRYRRTDETGESVPSASGDGLGQIDVLAVEGTDVVLSTLLYGLDRTNNQFVPSPGTGSKVPGAVVDGAWIHPAQLAKLQDARLNGVLILRGDYTLNGVTYQAISFANTAPGAYASYTYDLKTGLLLSATTSTAGATSPVTAPGQAPPQGNTQLTVTRLVGYRQRTVPGVAGNNPDWLARVSTLHYRGTYNFTNPVDPSSANLTYPMELTVDFGKGGSSWAPYSAQTYLQIPGGQPSTGSGVTGTAGLYWVDQSALQAMRPGQLLDQDPVTGEQLTVESVGAQAGSMAVTVTSQLPGVITSARYDQRSGVLISYDARIASSGATVHLELQERP